MKVTELRTWLEEFGEKNQEHYNRLHGSPTRLTPASTVHQAQTMEETLGNGDSAPSLPVERSHHDRDSGEDSPASTREGTHQVEGKTESSSPPRRTQNVPTQALVHEGSTVETLTIESGSSCDGSYGVLTKNRSNGDRTASTGVETGILPENSRSWDSSDLPSVSSWWSEEDFSDASFENEGGMTRSKPFPQSLLKSESPGRFTLGGVHGLESHMGPDHVAILSKQTPLIPSAAVDDGGSDVEPVSPEMTMHNASLFGNKTLTSGTLNFLCSENHTTITSIASNDVSVASSADGLKSTSSDDGSKPSIAPLAENSKICKVLLSSDIVASADDTTLPVQHETTGKDKEATILVANKPRRKLRDPKDLPFLQGKTTHLEKPSAVPRSMNVSTGIRKFGGTQKRMVERRKEELEKQWAENKAATHVKKIKWGVCQRTGTYKRKIVLDVQYK